MLQRLLLRVRRRMVDRLKLKVKQLGRRWSMLVGVQRQLARRLLMRLALVELMRTRQRLWGARQLVKL